jgi:hypothetical protein
MQREQLDIGLSNGSLVSWSMTVFPWIPRDLCKNDMFIDINTTLNC